MSYTLFKWSAILLCSVSSIVAYSSTDTLSCHYETAKEQCQDISCIRENIDRINDKILKLLAERTAYVKRAGDLKSKTTKIAEDRPRVAAQELKLIERSIELGLPLEISLSAFRAIVENSILFQQEYIDQSTAK